MRVLCTVQGVIRDENLELHNGRVRDRGTIVGVVNIVCSDRTGWSNSTRFYRGLTSRERMDEVATFIKSASSQVRVEVKQRQAPVLK